MSLREGENEKGEERGWDIWPGIGSQRATCLSRIRVCDKEMAVLVHGGSQVATLLQERIRPAQPPVHHLLLIWKSVQERLPACLRCQPAKHID